VDPPAGLREARELVRHRVSLVWVRMEIKHRLLRCLNGELFCSIKEARIAIEQWRVQDNTRRPHPSLGYRPPAPEA